MKTKQSLMASAIRAALFISVLAITGCETVDSASVRSFSVGVTVARAQSKTAFDTVAALTRESAIEYAATQPTLTENSLVTVPDAAAIAAWDAVLTPVEAYARKLSSLVSLESTGGVESSLEGLAKQFNTTSANLQNQAGVGGGTQLSAGQASAFAGVASALLRAKAHKQASEIIAEVDPAIRQLLESLADAIGKDAQSPGLRATVARNWAQRIAALQGEFLGATTASKREAITKKFVGVLTQRAAQDEMLIGVRGTLLSLADVHGALTEGSASDLKTAIDFITAELKHTRDLKTQFTATLSE